MKNKKKSQLHARCKAKKKKIKVQQDLHGLDWLQPWLVTCDIVDASLQWHGRSAEVTQVQQALRQGRTPLLVGGPGVGKTTVALAAVQTLASVGSALVATISIRRRMSALKKSRALAAEVQLLTDNLCQFYESDDRQLYVFIDDVDLVEPFDLECVFERLVMQTAGKVIGLGAPGPVRMMFHYQPSLAEFCPLIPIEEPHFSEAFAMVRLHDPAGEKWADDAVETAIEITTRFQGQRGLPGKALSVLKEQSSQHKLRSADVYQSFCRMETVPLHVVQPGVAIPEKAQIDSRVVGQKEAVTAVARAVTTLRAGLCDPSRPFATFMFAGPTGVGKTYIARLIAQNIFGSEERLVRINMADYQGQYAAATLFGDGSEKSVVLQRGVLATRLAQASFGVLLLDEFEKAHPTVHDALLPVLDEGCYINGRGEKVGCSSFFIIATSNAGASAFQQRLGFGITGDLRGSGAAQGAMAVDFRRMLAQSFRPELLNRFDEIVPFFPLSKDRIRDLAAGIIQDLMNNSSLKRQGWRVTADDSLLDYVAARGYDPDYGARFLRRSLQRDVIGVVADYVVNDEACQNQDIHLTVEDGMVVVK